MSISLVSVAIGDWERKDAGVCHPDHRASPEARGKVEEDAGEDGIPEVPGLPLTDRERSQRRAGVWSLQGCLFLQVGALVITPTRELALQISEVMGQFLQRFPQFTWVLFTPVLLGAPFRVLTRRWLAKFSYAAQFKNTKWSQVDLHASFVQVQHLGFGFRN